MSSLVWQNIQCVPAIHGRLAFALEVRRRLLSHRFSAVAVELPLSLKDGVEEALDRLPRISTVFYRHQPAFLEPEAPWYYMPVQPADAIVEALRIARGERIPVAWIDAELEEFHDRGVTLPDPHMIITVGLEAYVEACQPVIDRYEATAADTVRERHMAAKLAEVARAVEGDVLFVCGLAHWSRIRSFLEHEQGEVFDGEPVPADLVRVRGVHPRSIPHVVGELPYVVGRYERHRAGFELDDFEPILPLKELLLTTRRVHERDDEGSLERAEPQRLRTLLDYARKLTVGKRSLIPDAYDLVTAAKGVVGNDYALHLLTITNLYPYNATDAEPGSEEDQAWSEWVEDVYTEGGGADLFDCGGSAKEDNPTDESDPFRPDSESLAQVSGDRGHLDGDDVAVRNRLPGTLFQMGRLRLERRPEWDRRKEYRAKWDESIQCSWPPEDVVIENFRDYVGKRALSLARVGLSRSEPFTTSFLDGVDIRATLRDVVDRQIHVREEPRVPGAVGALVIIFEEDDFGEKFPWRTTWMAEHQNESTLAFYATDYHDNLIGPGIARAHYGGCLLIFPPLGIPNIWDDMRFERARTPSERLLLSGLYWSQDRYVVHVAKRPPRPEVREEAARRGRHVLHLPLSTFSRTTLERIRRVHVLNGQQVRTWAHRFIR